MTFQHLSDFSSPLPIEEEPIPSVSHDAFWLALVRVSQDIKERAKLLKALEDIKRHSARETHAKPLEWPEFQLAVYPSGVHLGDEIYPDASSLWKALHRQERPSFIAPQGPRETVEEYVSRGGTITLLPMSARKGNEENPFKNLTLEDIGL